MKKLKMGLILASVALLGLTACGEDVTTKGGKTTYGSNVTTKANGSNTTKAGGSNTTKAGVDNTTKAGGTTKSSSTQSHITTQASTNPTKYTIESKSDNLLALLDTKDFNVVLKSTGDTKATICFGKKGKAAWCYNPDSGVAVVEGEGNALTFYTYNKSENAFEFDRDVEEPTEEEKKIILTSVSACANTYLTMGNGGTDYERLGADTVNGRACTKYKYSYMIGTSGFEYTVWIDNELGFTAKYTATIIDNGVADTGTIEVTEFKLESDVVAPTFMEITNYETINANSNDVLYNLAYSTDFVIEMVGYSNVGDDAYYQFGSKGNYKWFLSGNQDGYDGGYMVLKLADDDYITFKAAEGRFIYSSRDKELFVSPEDDAASTIGTFLATAGGEEGILLGTETVAGISCNKYSFTWWDEECTAWVDGTHNCTLKVTDSTDTTLIDTLNFAFGEDVILPEIKPYPLFKEIDNVRLTIKEGENTTTTVEKVGDGIYYKSVYDDGDECMEDTRFVLYTANPDVDDAQWNPYVYRLYSYNDIGGWTEEWDWRNNLEDALYDLLNVKIYDRFIFDCNKASSTGSVDKYEEQHDVENTEYIVMYFDTEKGYITKQEKADGTEVYFEITTVTEISKLTDDPRI